MSRLARVLRSGRTALALALAAGSVALAACGDDEGGTIPQEKAAGMLATVDRLQQNAADGNCTLADDAASDLRSQVDQLPKEVGEQTKSDLFDLVNRLEDLLSQCQEPDAGTSGETGVVTPTTSTTTTTSTDTDTETDTETEPPPEQPSDEGTGVPGGGNQGGNSNAGGNGNAGGNSGGGGTSGGTGG
jgi:hypothetical protein